MVGARTAEVEQAACWSLLPARLPHLTRCLYSLVARASSAVLGHGVDIVRPGVSILSGGCRQRLAHANIYCLTSNSGCGQGDAGDGGPGN